MTTDSQDSPTTPDETQARPKPRWGRRLLVLFVLVGGAVAALGPSLATRFVHGLIEGRGSDAIHGTVTVRDLSLTWNGKAHLAGLLVEDAAGDRVMSVDDARLDVGVRSLLTGKKDVSLHVDGFHVELVRGVDGDWNVARLPRASEDGAPTEPGEPIPTTPPDLEGRVHLRGGSIVLRDARRALALDDVELRVSLDGDQREYAIAGSARIAGGDGSAGDFELRAALWPDAAEGLRVDGLDLTGFEVGVLAEVLAIVGSPLGVGSRLSGELDLSVAGRVDGFGPDAPLALEGRGEARGLDIDIRDADGLEALRFQDELATLTLGAARGADAAPRADLALSARGDKLRLAAHWDASSEQGLRASVDVDGIAASAGLEPLLARVHPVFAGARAVKGAGVDGLVSSHVEVVYDAPLPLEALAAGWGALDKEPLSGTGDLSVAEGLVETSPFFDELLSALERSGRPTFDLSPLRFAVEGGRLSYADPWTWTIEGAETRFVGSVGLDGTLALRWDVPIVAGLANTNRVFRALEGEAFRLDLDGTLTSPRLDVAGALASLAKRAAQRELENRARDEIEQRIGGDVREKIDEEVGRVKGDIEDAAREILGGGDTAQGLLTEADRLWGEGKRAEAAALYRKLRKDHPLSPVYLLNKSRVKSRKDG